jgi:hypothetical protein
LQRSLLVLVLVGLLVTGPPAVRADEPPAYVATIQTAQGRYRAVIRDPEMVERARRELAGEGDAGVPIGPLAWGSGGVNRGHVWHVVDLTFADFTIELCDGTVRDVDRDPVYWVETVRAFCPWSGEVVRLKPLRLERLPRR